MLPEFKKRIDTLRDILVGAVPSPAGQIEQITYALIYKFMSDIDDKAAGLPGGKRTYFTGEFEKYGWHNLLTNTLGAHDRLTLYREALGKMVQNPGLPVLFQEIYENAYLTFNDPRILTLFLKEIDNFKHSNSDDIGDAYEYLLQITGAQGDVGQFRTPRHIIKFITEAVNPGKNDSVLDPAVGTAGFLIAAYNHVKHHHDGIDDNTGLASKTEQQLTSDEREKLYRNYHGFDIDPTMVRTAKVNMYLHGFTTPDIKNHDSLSSEDWWNERYDIILANPPFMSPKGGIKPHDKFGIVANRAEVLFVDYIASHLKPSGRAGIVVPEGIIYHTGKAHTALRKNIVDDGLVAVIGLPSGVFQPYSGVKTSVLIIDKAFAKKSDSILFVDVKNIGLSLSRARKTVKENDLGAALEIYKAFIQDSPFERSKSAFSVEKQLIAENGYDLTSRKYWKRPSGSGAMTYVRFEDVCKISKGKSSSTKTVAGEYPLVLMAEQFKTSQHYDFEGEGVCVPLMTAASTGTAVMKRVHYVNGKFALANLLAFVEPIDTAIIHPLYLYKVLLLAVDELAGLMKGSANVSMKTSDLGTFEIPLPSLDTQMGIVKQIEIQQEIIETAKRKAQEHEDQIAASIAQLWND